jgi:peptide-methionine (S)-S-oxide reductase
VLDFLFPGSKQTLVTALDALPGRQAPAYAAPDPHLLWGTPIDGEPPPGMSEIVVAMGCFWGAERVFWRVPGVWTTAVGYVGGYSPHATYEEVCTGRTGHTEAVRVVFDPDVVSLDEILRQFWESHDPTQGMAQGNDVGTQYRSGIYWTTTDQRDAVLASLQAYQESLRAAGRGEITTEIKQLGADPATGGAGPFYYAEDYHQQYLAKGALRSGLTDREKVASWYLTMAPDHAAPQEGYCSMRGTGVACPR